MAKARFDKVIFPKEAALIRDKVGEVFQVADVAHWWCARSRRRNIVEARQVLMHLLRFYCRLGVAEVGLYCDRDHSTVCHACDTVYQLRKQPNLRKFNTNLRYLEEFAERNTGGSVLDETHYPEHLRPTFWPTERRNETIGYI